MRRHQIWSHHRQFTLARPPGLAHNIWRTTTVTSAAVIELSGTDIDALLRDLESLSSHIIETPDPEAQTLLLEMLVAPLQEL